MTSLPFVRRSNLARIPSSEQSIGSFYRKSSFDSKTDLDLTKPKLTLFPPNLPLMPPIRRTNCALRAACSSWPPSVQFPILQALGSDVPLPSPWPTWPPNRATVTIAASFIKSMPSAAAARSNSAIRDSVPIVKLRSRKKRLIQHNVSVIIPENETSTALHLPHSESIDHRQFTKRRQ